ncbi:hypothetical protein S40293_08713 [Stachybotrys chartarum IBT 40293]|nr:hypothetical protein S40293_08713 [Stachybotrys chartarum IBT 40293]
MKSGYTEIYASRELGEEVTSYAEQHSTPLPRHITDYHAASSDREDSMMLSSNFQSQLHLFLAGTVGAKRGKSTNLDLLEIGVFLGYSAMVWSHAVGPDGLVTGLEYSPEYAAHAEKALAANGINNVELIVGPAAETLPQLSPAIPYDLVFIDADKEGYSGYLKQLLEASRPDSPSPRLLRPGALILADNVLRRGYVVSEASIPPEARSEDKLRQVRAVRAFNDQCLAEPRLQTFLIPLWDGLSALRLID